jgi:hypothetical protein
MNVNDSVRVQMSTGLFALAVFHVVLLGAACYVGHQGVPAEPVPQWTPPTYQPYYPQGNFQSQCVPSVESAPVNLSAQGELKQGELKQASPAASPQLIEQCAPCNQRPVAQPTWSNSNPFNLAPGERLLSVDPIVTTPTYGFDYGFPASQRVTYPAYGGSTVADRPAAKKFQVLLFLDSSPRSQVLHNWFQTDPKLAGLRAQADFQVYTGNSPLYRTRYHQLVPADQFPVCLVQDATGGHIHAAGKQMIPTSANELVSDIATAYELYKEAKQGVIQQTGALKTAGYSWDDNISPSMRLQASDCVGPLCPPSQPDPFAGGLFRPDNRVNNNPLQALFWGSPNDLATIFVFGLAALLLVFIMARRR